MLQHYTFEVYGIEDYLNDFYNKTLDIAGITGRIQESTEVEVGAQTYFESDYPCSKIIEVVKKYNEWHMHIL